MRQLLLALFLPGWCYASVVQLDFSADITGAQGVFAGTTGTITGQIIFDDSGTPSQTGPAIYPFSGSPYKFMADIPTAGLVNSPNVSALVGDNGSNVWNMDDFSLYSTNLSNENYSDFWVILKFIGPIDSFSGESIPSTTEIESMNNFFGLYFHGNINPQISASLTSYSVTVVPLPAAIWLYGSIVGLLGLISWRQHS